MIPSRWLYRVRQFWAALTARPTSQDLQHAQTILSQAQMALFTRLQASEQAHPLNVLRRLEEQGHKDPDLLVAALLHDVGKARYRLTVWGRVVVVLGKALFPEKAVEWGQGQPRGLQRPFVIAAQHPEWGAQMAQEAGVSEVAVALIRRHQDEVTGAETKVDELLLALQAVDDES